MPPFRRHLLLLTCCHSIIAIDRPKNTGKVDIATESAAILGSGSFRPTFVRQDVKSAMQDDIAGKYFRSTGMSLNVGIESNDPGVKNSSEGRVLGIYHLNINVTNLDQSRKFYELLGFRVIDTFHEKHNANLDRGLGLPADTNSENRALFMAVGSNQYATVIDLAEWVAPKGTGGGPKLPYALGVPRFCLRVKNLDHLVARLKSHGVTFLSEEPQRLDTLRRKPRFICCHDPDGVIVEMVELV